ncbi:hypothetical protein vBSdyM006_082 [Shigella phage vB_SdyM_006]|nr:hypothetical protein vBSdyM006_082 [Shigella phage vB_SdyM_006]
MGMCSRALILCDDKIKAVNDIIDCINLESKELNSSIFKDSFESLNVRNKTNSICELIAYNLECFRLYFTRNKSPKSIFVVTINEDEYKEHTGDSAYVYLNMNHSEENIDIMNATLQAMIKLGYTVFYDENDCDESGFEKI